MRSDWAALPPIQASWLGQVPYRQAWLLQQERREALLRGEPVPEVIWALEHDPVLTTGLRPAADLPALHTLHALGAEHVRVERGGLATWHAPGQLVLYAVVRLPPRGLGPKSLVSGLEQAMVSLLADLGVAAHLRAGAPGVWAGDAKIGSVGVHVRRGVSLHGAALNLDLDLSPFELFVPCGLSGVRMTSVAAVRGRSPSAQDVAELACQHVLWSLLAASVDGGAATR